MIYLHFFTTLRVFEIKIEYAERIGRLPKYIFAAIEELISKKTKEGADLIKLGIGDPDLTTPEIIMNEMTMRFSKCYSS